MRNYGRVAFLATIGYVVLAAILALTVSSESPGQGVEGGGAVFFFLNALVLLPCLPVAFLLRRDPFSPLGHAVIGLSFILYPALGQWYHPGFESVLFALLAAFAMFYHPRRSLFFGVTSSASVLLGWVYWHRLPHNVAILARPVPVIELSAIWIVFLVSAMIYFGFNDERARRQAALERLSLIGRHGSAIIHDVKNMMATPHIQVQALKELLEAAEHPELRATVAELQGSMSSVNRVIFDLNQMVSLVGKKEESFSLAALVDEVRDLLRYKLERVEVVVSGDLQLYGDRVLLYSIFLTVFLNSLETFKLMRVENERIELEIRGSRLVYHDNSGAWPLSETDQNLGPYLVQTGLAEFGGKAQYLKDPNGTKIQMNFH